MRPTDFLKAFHADGPWVLSAIVVDRKGIDTKTFGPETEEAAQQWIDRYNKERNLYFSVNIPFGNLDKKATRKDIELVPWLHVDIDARAGEELEAELERILKLLTEDCPVLSPTFIIYSGGGYQAFWKLTEPIIIKGELAAAEEAARYNKELEIILGGDGCHNIDRIMRLPGTMNIPDKKKRERGRKRTEAEVYSYDKTTIYDLSVFQQAPEVQFTSEPPSVQKRRIEDINNLQINDRLKIIAVQGHDPDNPKSGDDSRSAWVFDFVCNGLREGLNDETLYSIITDRDYAISTHVLEQQRWHDYALRQISEARRIVAQDEAAEDPVAWVNARYFAAMEGGKVAFYREEDKGIIEAMQSSAFDFELLPKKHKINSVLIPYSKLWKSSERRRYYPRGFVLDPKAAPGTGHYNLWKGFSVQPAQGEWSRMRTHIHQVLADGNEEYADYIIRWTAWTLQNPNIPPRVALAFQSDREGVGKGAFCNALVHLFGAHGLRIQDMMQLTGRFNAHLRHCCLLFADEAVTPGTDGEGALKGYITEPTVPIERKGVDVVQADNHLHIVISSNNRAIVPAGPSARRFAVFTVSDRYARHQAYFEKLFAEINGQGLPAMLHDLLALDLGAWHPEAARPDTDALAYQKVESLPPVEATWFDILLEGELPHFVEKVGGQWKIRTQGMRDYIRDQRRRPDISSNKVSDLFKTLEYEYVSSTRPRGYMLPPLEKARQDWDERFFPWPWDKGGEWYGTPL